MSKFTWTPIRKLAVTGLTYLVVLGARKAFGIDLGPESVNGVVDGAIALAAGYAVKDPRVQHVADELEDSVLAAQVEEIVLDQLAKLER